MSSFNIEQIFKVKGKYCDELDKNFRVQFVNKQKRSCRGYVYNSKIFWFRWHLPTLSLQVYDLQILIYCAWEYTRTSPGNVYHLQFSHFSFISIHNNCGIEINRTINAVYPLRICLLLEEINLLISIYVFGANFKYFKQQPSIILCMWVRILVNALVLFFEQPVSA